MSIKIQRHEQFAVINRENKVRVLLVSEGAAHSLVRNLCKISGSCGPYRVARVTIEEVIPEAQPYYGR